MSVRTIFMHIAGSDGGNGKQRKPYVMCVCVCCALHYRVNNILGKTVNVCDSVCIYILLDDSECLQALGYLLILH